MQWILDRSLGMARAIVQLTERGCFIAARPSLRLVETSDLPDEAEQEFEAFPGFFLYDSLMTNRTFKTGESREQACLLPPRIEDYVGPDNPVRAIDGFVDALDLAELGFRHAKRGVGGG